MNRTETARAFVAFCQAHAQLQNPEYRGGTHPTLFRPASDLVSLLEPLVRDFPGSQTVIQTELGPQANVRVNVGKARVTVYLDAPIDAPWAPPADALGAAMTREEHANNVGIAIRVAASGAGEMNEAAMAAVCREHASDPFAPFETWADEIPDEDGESSAADPAGELDADPPLSPAMQRYCAARGIDDGGDWVDPDMLGGEG